MLFETTVALVFRIILGSCVLLLREVPQRLGVLVVFGH